MNPATLSEPPPVRRPRISIWTIVLTFATVIFVLAAIFLRHSVIGANDQFYGQWIGKEAPDFTLTDQDGRPLSLSALRGKLVLMTFGFTHCPNICPTTLANLAGICQGLPARDQDRVRVLFITVDPARDDPKALRDYVHFYSKAFIGLTGHESDIKKVAKNYGAYFEAVMQESQVASNYYTVQHSAYIYLIDPEGRFALLYDNDKLADHARMSLDIQRILAATAQ